MEGDRSSVEEELVEEDEAKRILDTDYKVWPRKTKAFFFSLFSTGSFLL